MNRLWVVAYDIEDDRIRRGVHKLLYGFGEPVQYSVFECWLSHSQFIQLRVQVRSLIEREDSVRWYPLCVWCRKKIEWQGTGSESGDPPYILL